MVRDIIKRYVVKKSISIMEAYWKFTMHNQILIVVDDNEDFLKWGGV